MRNQEVKGKQEMNSPQASKSLEERVASLETKINYVERQLLRLEEGKKENIKLKESMVAVTDGDKIKTANSITVSLVSKNFHKANLNAGDVEDRIDFVLIFNSYLVKDIRAFKGRLIIKDLFEQEIITINLTDEGGIRSGDKYEWKGGIKFNKFSEQHQRLLNISTKDALASFVLESVIYIDGTRENFVY